MVKQNKAAQYIDYFGILFAKLPNLSLNSKKAIVSAIPYLSLIFGTLGVALTLTALGIFTIIEPIAQVTGVKGTGGNFFFVLLSLISSILLLSSFSGAQKKKAYGWNRIYYSRVVALASNIMTLSIDGFILSLVGFYILYQIRKYYS